MPVPASTQVSPSYSSLVLVLVLVPSDRKTEDIETSRATEECKRGIVVETNRIGMVGVRTVRLVLTLLIQAFDTRYRTVRILRQRSTHLDP